MKRVIYLIGIVLVLCVIWYLTTLIPLPPRAPSENAISVATSTLMASTTNYTVEADYPQFGIPVIDSQIKQQIDNGVSDLESQAVSDQPAANGFPIYDFTSAFDSVYVGPDYISVRLILADYTGGAHELPVIIGDNFHRDTGELATLDEALSLTGMTLDQVASSSKAQLAQNPDTQPTDIWTSGSDPTPNNYSTFLINKDSVIFIFQPYQVAPFSSGAPEVTFPRTK